MRLFEFIDKEEKHYAIDPLEFDGKYNPEAEAYSSMEIDRAKKLKKLSKKGTPVITHDECETSEKWTNQPPNGEDQTSGFKGEQAVKQRVGLPHKKYNDVDPRHMKRDTLMPPASYFE